MKRLSILIIGVLSLLGCARNTDMPLTSYGPQISIIPLEGRAWLDNVPSGDYAIGISYLSPHNTEDSCEAARDFAALSLSRNHSSYIVDKHSSINRSSQESNEYKTADFNLVVSQDLAYLRRSVDGLRLIHHFEASGYYIALFGFEETAVDSSLHVMNALQLPVWAQNTGLRVEDGKIICSASSRQASLIDAFFVAQELALRQIGRHLILRVNDDLIVEDNLINQRSSFESVSKSPSFDTDKVYIRHLMIDENPSYEVIIQLKEA